MKSNLYVPHQKCVNIDVKFNTSTPVRALKNFLKNPVFQTKQLLAMHPEATFVNI